ERGAEESANAEGDADPDDTPFARRARETGRVYRGGRMMVSFFGGLFALAVVLFSWILSLGFPSLEFLSLEFHSLDATFYPPFPPPFNYTSTLSF
ncbi:hypothetical protein B0H12DRAFT_1121952, partial [Mycena haematopus]